MKKSVQISIVAIFLLSLCLLLKFYFESSYFLIAVILLLGLLFGIISRSFVGYVIPGETLFRYRFIINGAGFGLMIGLVLFSSKAIKDQSFLIQDLVKWILIAVPTGILWDGVLNARKFNKIKKRIFGNNGQQNLLCNFATLTDSAYKTDRGFLALSGNKLSFYNLKNSNCQLEIPLSNLHPEIRKSTLFHIPNGFSIRNKAYNLTIAFPLYWIKLIENEIKNQK